MEKGSAVYVEGALRTRSFKDSNDEQRRVTEIKATRIQFLDARSDSADAPEEVAADEAV